MTDYVVLWYLDTLETFDYLAKGGDKLEYTNDVIQDMKDKKLLYNPKIAMWYKKKYLESGGQIDSVIVEGRRKHIPVGGQETYFNKSERIFSCCDLWIWDKYEKNKLLDLKRLNRCKDSRFCPNCKKMNTAKFIHEVNPKIKSVKGDYEFFMLTLTVPSEHLDGLGLSDFISKLYKTFYKLNRKFSMPLYTPTGKLSSLALQDRYIVFAGGIRVLEITYSKVNGYHPHLHCLVAVKKNSVDFRFLEKSIYGKWSNKRESYNMKSLLDIQIGKAWSMLWYGIDFRKWNKVQYFSQETFLYIDDVVSGFKALEVDFRPMDDEGIFEVIKYTFKSSDIENYDVFSVLVEGMAYKRVRQGFGIFHDLKCDDDTDGEMQPLILDYEEEPEQVLTREFLDLLDTFAEYRKISRFNPAENDVLFRLADMD